MDNVFSRWVGCVLLFSCFTYSARAIPNQFGGTTSFINPAGMRLEDFVAQNGIWQANAELKGAWELWNDESVTDSSIELLHLAMPAIVFGVASSEVTLQRKDDRILSFQVVFEPQKPERRELAKLGRTVRRNASVWSGGDASADQFSQGAAEYFIEEFDEENCIVVTIRPKQ